MRKILSCSAVIAALAVASSHVLKAQSPVSETSSSIVIKGEELEKYPTTDLLNALTGMVPGLWVTEKSGATGVRAGASNCSLQSRGYGSIIFIIDGVIVSDPSEFGLLPEEIESVTLLTDIADKLKYGPEAGHGALLIKTLRGSENGHRIRISVEEGADFVDRMPEWCGGVDYARLNNMARINSGYPARFTEEDIKGFSAGNPFSWDYANVDWRALILKNSRHFNKATAVVQGGQNKFRYSADLCVISQGEIYAVGAKSNFSRYNARLNFDIGVTENLKINFGFLGTYSIQNFPEEGYNSHSDSRSVFASILKRVNTIPAIEFPIYLREDEETGKPIYPVSSNYGNHPYASMLETGSQRECVRTALTNGTIEYQFPGILKGLHTESHISSNIYYLTRQGLTSDYTAYLFNRKDYSQEVTSHKGESSSQADNYDLLYLQGLQFSQNLGYDRTWGRHVFGASTMLYISKLGSSSDGAYHKQFSNISTLNYSFDNRYFLDLTANYAGTSARKRGHRYRLFPSAGLAWEISNEPFMKGVSSVNKLRLRGQVGQTGYEPYSTQFYWESNFTKSSALTFGPYSGSTRWFGTSTWSSTATTESRCENADLGWETGTEFSFGLDARLFGGLSFSYTHYDSVDGGILQDVNSLLPSFYGVAGMYENYNAVHYWGDEIAASYSFSRGDFSMRIGASMLHDEAKYAKYLQANTFDYMKYEGKNVGSVLMYNYLGKFRDEADIADSPTQSFEATVKPGDLKYEDKNGDGVVNENDRQLLGNTRPRFQYALNLHLAYKFVDLTIVGTGKACFDAFMTNDYYWNGGGDSNYSAWTRDKVYAGEYPRFEYVQSKNNFQTSQYWMIPGGFFKIQNVELGFNLGKVRLFARGANLLTISKIKYTEPENQNAGVTSYPLMKTVTGGIKVTF